MLSKRLVNTILVHSEINTSAQMDNLFDELFTYHMDDECDSKSKLAVCDDESEEDFTSILKSKSKKIRYLYFRNLIFFFGCKGIVLRV